nr:TlyA family RNA methyltransferase [Acetonema longum]
MKKERLDILLVERGLAPSRERGKAYVMAGLVFVNDKKVEKAGAMIASDALIRVAGDSIGYVSRGGLKLAKALQVFDVDLNDKTMIDIGASTGGFTDCALKNGAKRVHAIDVGYGQLAWSLRTDPRVINMERTNIRTVTLADIGEAADFISIDVAFISLRKVLPVAKNLLKENGCIIALIKPQFEAGKEKVGKKGVVRDPEVHIDVIQTIVDFARQESLLPQGLTFSPVKGPEGNIEYLVYLLQSGQDQVDSACIARIVASAGEELSS